MLKKIKRLPNSMVEMEIEIDAEEFDRFFERAINRLAREIDISGFRKGKIPREITLERIGREKILLEAANSAIGEKYLQAVSEEKLEPISQPEIKILKSAYKNPFVFRISFCVLPEIRLPRYQDIVSKIKKEPVFAKDLEIQEALDWFQNSRAKYISFPGPAQKGDFVEIEFFSLQIENGTKQNDAFILGKGRLVSGFEEKLEGMKTGETKKFSLEFPQKHFQKQLAGKLVDFEVKMTSVNKVELPEINDQFASQIGNFNDLSSLKKSVKEGIVMEKEMAEKARLRQRILEEILKDSQLEVPGIMVAKEKENMLEEIKSEVLKNLKISFEDYLKKLGKSEKEISDSLLERAERKVKHFLILREIGRIEKITVLKEELTGEMNQILKNYPDVEGTKKNIDLDRLRAYTEEKILIEKTLQRLESFIE